ncbi:hypothetical protein [Psychromicrobium sp. YIM B11713]|uniref:hypothetical protein n=1 Tax=Psychromicrobium sp. YIM B11713 TaxID=3145233 RepID=UPI00374F2580
MSRLITAIQSVATALLRLAEEQGQMVDSQAETAKQQRVTNLIVRSQVEPDQTEKSRLLAEARYRMDAPNRRGLRDHNP